MLIDFPSAPAPESSPFDVCIVGGGIAGLLIAHELASSAKRVAVLEAGAAGPLASHEPFFEADTAGDAYAGHLDGRCRALGGSSLLWGGQLLPLEPHDFEPRPFIALSGWPIGAADLAPYLRDIESILGVDDLPYDSKFATGRLAPLAFDAGTLEYRYTKWVRFRNRNLWNLLRSRLESAPNVHVFQNAPVVRLATGREGRCVEAAVVARTPHAHHIVKADSFVLCLGTLETTRLLLASNDVHPQGLGNANGWVGRCFQDHLSFRAADLDAPTARDLAPALCPLFVGATMHYPRLQLTPPAQRRLECLGTFAHLQFDAPDRSAFSAVRDLLRGRQSSGGRLPGLRDIARVAGDLPYFLRLAWSAKVGGMVPIPSGARPFLQVDVEQEPNRESRLTLAAARDALGMPRLRIDWRIGEREHSSAAKFVALLREQWHRLGLGGMQLRPELGRGIGAWKAVVRDTYHQTGTTRMSATAETGVVDRDLRIFGVENAFVASCSVFPTGGSANPTFTLMALALRLSKRLKES